MSVLALYGGIGTPRGDYSGKTEQAIVEAATTGGGKKRRFARKYPRWVLINGQRYRVKNAEEERQLLRAMQDRADAAAKTAEALGDEKLARQAKKRAIRIENRIAAVDSREAEWLQRLRDEDEELLLMVN